MKRTRMMLAAVGVALSLSVSGTGVALAQDQEGYDPALAEQCGSYNFFEWLIFGHPQCHGHTDPFIVYWPS